MSAANGPADGEAFTLNATITVRKGVSTNPAFTAVLIENALNKTLQGMPGYDHGAVRVSVRGLGAAGENVYKAANQARKAYKLAQFMYDMFSTVKHIIESPTVWAAVLRGAKPETREAYVRLAGLDGASETTWMMACALLECRIEEEER